MSSAQERPAGAAGPAPADETTGRPGQAGTGYQRVGAHRAADYEYEDIEVSPVRAGFTVLAAVLLIFSGLVTVFYGMMGVVKGSFFTTVSNYAFYYSVRGRGITYLAIGAVVFATGVCILLGMLWARIVGVVLAVLSGIFNFMFLPYYPIWSIIVIALDVIIIWALTTGGSERRLAGG